MTVRLRDIANQLNLSPALVSGVLNNRPNVWASEETRERVRCAAREMGYRPNAAALALSRGKACAIAFVAKVPDDAQSRSLYMNVAGILGLHLNAAGWEMLTRLQTSQEETLASLTELARARACDAFVLWGRDADVEEQALHLEKLGRPFVAKGHHEAQHPNWPQIEYDHAAMMEAVVARLTGLGHRRIAYIGYTTEDAFRYHLRDGFQAAMQRRFGAPAALEYIAEFASELPDVPDQMQRWFAMTPDKRPTALAIGTGEQTWRGVELALAQRGMVIGEHPGAFSVAGITNIPMTLFFGQGYSFPNINLSELAEAAATRLLPALMNDTPLSDPIVRICPQLQPLPSHDLLRYVQFRHPVEDENEQSPARK